MSTRDSQSSVAAFVWITTALICAALAVAKPRTHTVYPIYTYAAGEWAAGRDIYVEAPGFDFFRYSPTVAAFFVPWRCLGDAWGAAVWRLLGVGILAAGIIVWSRDALGRSANIHVSWLFLLITPFLLQNVNNGQANSHVLGLLLLGTASVATDRVWQAAMLLTAAALFKPYVLTIAALIGLIERRLLPRLIVMLGVGLALPFLFQTPDYVARQYGEWFQHLLGNDRGTLGLRSAYRDIGLLFRQYFVPLPASAYLTVSATVGLLLAWLVWRSVQLRQSRSGQICRAFALGSCWMTVLGPATESCTYLLLAPTLAAVVLSRSGRSGRWVRASYAIFIGTISASLFPQDWQVQALGPQPIAGSILLFELVRESVAAIRRPPQVVSTRVSLAA
jgi:hypothetical protein